MRTLLLCALPLLIACQPRMTSPPDADMETARSQTQDTIRVVNATDQPFYFIHMPARSARPLRREVPLTLSDPPDEYLEAGRDAPLRHGTCDARDRLTGDTLLLYRVGTPDAEGQTTAVLASKRSFTPELLSTIADDECRLVIASLDDAP